MNYAIILAGGKGSRMKSDIPKQFLKLNDIPMICYSIETFEANDNIDRIVVVTSADYIGYMEKIIRSQGYKKIIAVVDALVSRAIRLTKESGMDKLALAGGVASNSALRKTLKEECDKNAINFYSPSPIFCTDNAAMIGVAAYYEYISGTRHGYDLNAIPNLKLGERV